MDFNGNSTEGETATSVTYDNTTSGLVATDVQDAIDEISGGGGGGVTNPYVGTFKATDLATDNYVSINAELLKIDNIPLISQSTGLLTGGIVSINGGDDTLFDISDGTGQIVTTGGVITPVSWTGKTGVSLPFTSPLTNVSIQTGGVVVVSPTPPTTTNRRDEIFIGVLGTTNLVNITGVLNEPTYLGQTANSLRDLAEAVGLLNVSGNVLAPSVLLTLQKSAGTIFQMGSNVTVNLKSPHISTVPLIDTNAGGDFFYIYQDGSNNGGQTDIIPNQYDDGNGIGAPGNVTMNDWSTSRVFVNKSAMGIQPGQTVYNTLAAAQAAVFGETFNVNAALAAVGMLVGYIIVRGGATDLNSSADALFIQSGKFGGGGASAGGGNFVALDNAAQQTMIGALSMTQLKAPTIEINSLVDITAGLAPIGVKRTYTTVNTESTETVPANAGKVKIRCWGAGGGTAQLAIAWGGGGGAFSETIMDVTPGDTMKYYIGQGGNRASQLGTIMRGGGLGSAVNDGIGGGGTLVAFDNTGSFTIKCCSGGGGGAGGTDTHSGGYGGQPGGDGDISNVFLFAGGGDNGVGGIGDETGAEVGGQGSNCNLTEINFSSFDGFGGNCNNFGDGAGSGGGGYGGGGAGSGTWNNSGAGAGSLGDTIENGIKGGAGGGKAQLTEDGLSSTTGDGGVGLAVGFGGAISFTYFSVDDDLNIDGNVSITGDILVQTNDAAIKFANTDASNMVITNNLTTFDDGLGFFGTKVYSNGGFASNFDDSAGTHDFDIGNDTVFSVGNNNIQCERSLRVGDGYTIAIQDSGTVPTAPAVGYGDIFNDPFNDLSYRYNNITYPITGKNQVGSFDMTATVTLYADGIYEVRWNGTNVQPQWRYVAAFPSPNDGWYDNSMAYQNPNGAGTRAILYDGGDVSATINTWYYFSDSGGQNTSFAAESWGGRYDFTLSSEVGDFQSLMGTVYYSSHVETGKYRISVNKI